MHFYEVHIWLYDIPWVKINGQLNQRTNRGSFKKRCCHEEGDLLLLSNVKQNKDQNQPPNSKIKEWIVKVPNTILLYKDSMKIKEKNKK